MTNRSFLSVVAILLGFSCANARAEKPNIVVIVADDMGFADVGFNGCTDIKTPNLDRLAKSGARLEQFYVQPLCSPTRAALLTGRYPMRMGLQVGVVRPWAGYGLPLEERTLAQALKDVGYETAIVGKWHLGHVSPEYLPTRRGFDHQYGHYNGALDYYTHDRDGGFDWHRDDKVNRDEGYSTHLIASEAVKRIEGRDAKKSLFLYVPFNAVHSPHQVPGKYKEPYAGLKEPRRTYAGMLAAMDEGIGKILDAIEAKGMRESTLVLFTSDNGGPQPGKVTSNGMLRAGKGTVYEGGVRVAACVAWPGKIPAGGAVTQPMHVVDVYPTLVKLAGGDVSEGKQMLAVDGEDVWETITKNAATSGDRAILLNATPVNGAIRVGDWKLVIGGGRGAGEDADGEPTDPTPKTVIAANASGELFNLATDPGEKKDVAAANPEKVKELRAAYDKLAAQAIPPKAEAKAKDFKSPAVWGEK